MEVMLLKNKVNYKVHHQSKSEFIHEKFIIIIHYKKIEK